VVRVEVDDHAADLGLAQAVQTELLGEIHSDELGILGQGDGEERVV
jgi:hypothetical protein